MKLDKFTLAEQGNIELLAAELNKMVFQWYQKQTEPELAVTAIMTYATDIIVRLVQNSRDPGDLLEITLDAIKLRSKETP